MQWDLEPPCNCRLLWLAVIIGYMSCRLKGLRLSDSRVRVMNEVISGMRVIKMYAWEYAFKKLVDKIRKYEYAYILVNDNTSLSLHHCRTETFVLLQAASIHACNFSMFTVLYSVTLFILFISIPSEYFGARQVFTTLSVVAYFRKENVIYFMSALMKLSDLNEALTRIKVRVNSCYVNNH